jgi:hypothetical protein
MENHNFQWVNPYKWSYSIAMLNYQRVPLKTLVKGMSKDSTTRPQPKAGTLAFYVRYRYMFAMVINIHHNLTRLHIAYSRFPLWDESPHHIYHVLTMSHLLILWLFPPFPHWKGGFKKCQNALLSQAATRKVLLQGGYAKFNEFVPCCQGALQDGPVQLGQIKWVDRYLLRSKTWCRHLPNEENTAKKTIDPHNIYICMYPIHVKANRPFRMPDRLAETKEHLPDVFF